MKRFKLMVIFAMFMVNFAHSQQKVIVKVVDKCAIINNNTEFYDRLFFNCEELNNLFMRYELPNLRQAYFNANKFTQSYERDELLKFYEFDLTDLNKSIIDSLSNDVYKSLVFSLEISDVAVPTYTPNDFTNSNPNFNQSSHLELINAKLAWDISKGDNFDKIAILECCNSFDINHPDLISNISFTDIPNDALKLGDDHGTTVAGAASAATDNGIGISSIGFNSKLMLYSGINKNWYDLMLKAANDGARIISCSWRLCNYVQSQQDVINFLTKQNVLVVASAGNPSNKCATPPNHYSYPASYDNVLSVSSVGHIFDYGVIDPIFGPNNWKDVHEEIPGNPQTAHVSNDRVDIVAPGYNIYSTSNNNSYSGNWGTSYSAPIISGTLALLLAVNPTLNPTDLTNIIKSTAKDIYSIPENMKYIGKLGAGRVDAFEAVKKALKHPGGANFRKVESNECLKRLVSYYGFQQNFNAGVVNYSWQVEGSGFEILSNTNDQTIRLRIDPTASFTLKLTI